MAYKSALLSILISFSLIASDFSQSNLLLLFNKKQIGIVNGDFEECSIGSAHRSLSEPLWWVHAYDEDNNTPTHGAAGGIVRVVDSPTRSGNRAIEFKILPELWQAPYCACAEGEEEQALANCQTCLHRTFNDDPDYDRSGIHPMMEGNNEDPAYNYDSSVCNYYYPWSLVASMRYNDPDSTEPHLPAYYNRNWRQRSEIAYVNMDNLGMVEGKTVWYSWSFYMHNLPDLNTKKCGDDPYNTDYRYINIMQMMEQVSTDNIPLAQLKITGSNNSLRLDFKTYDDDQLVINELETGLWYDIALNIKWSTSENGFIKVYVRSQPSGNYTLVRNDDDVKTLNYSQVNSRYIKFGFYWMIANRYDCVDQISMVFDKLRVSVDNPVDIP